MAIAASLLLSACAGSQGSTPTGPSSPPGSLSGSLFVTVPTGLFPGDSADATVSVRSDGNGFSVFEPTTQATWVSSNLSVAVITPAGRVTAVAPGTAQLTATYQGKSASGTISVAADADLLRIEVVCPTEMVSGEGSLCLATARLRSGAPGHATFDWSSTRPDIVSIDSRGAVRAQSVTGVATIAAAYRGREGTAQVAVTAKDAVRVGATAEQGAFRSGGRPTWTFIGSYSVQSAATGRLTLRVTAQDNVVLATESRTVPRGGDSFVLPISFDIPATATRVCGLVTLEIGSTTLGDESTMNCRSVTP